MGEAYTLTAWLETGATAKYVDEECLSLLQRCLQGEEAAFMTLYNRHAGMVYRLAFGLLQNNEDAEEVLQDSFEYAFRKLDHYNPQQSAFTSWLYRITVSRCRNKRRRKWLATIPLRLLPQQEVPDPQSLPPENLVELNEQEKLIWEALMHLSDKLRETAVLRYYHGLPFNEIGEILGIPAKTAESRVRLAHKALKKVLEKSDVLR